MYVVEIYKLEPGDILLTTGKHVVSKAIKVATKSNFSHAMLHVGGGSYIHSDGEGVHAGNIQRLLFKKESYVQVLRLKRAIGRDQVIRACVFARTQIGKQYSVKDAINVKARRVTNTAQHVNRQFCSRLVAQAYESADIKLVSDPNYCSPQEILESDLIEVVEGCVRRASETEITFANSENPLEQQATITNDILSQARALTGHDIQTFEQLVHYLIENPHHDSGITKIVRESEYLYLWQYELQKNPWRYNKEIFMGLELPRSEMLEMAKQELESAKQTYNQYAFMYQQYMTLWQLNQLRYIAVEIMLYQKLLEITRLRIDTSTYVLNSE